MSKKFPLKLHRLDLFPNYWFCYVPSADALKRVCKWAELNFEFPPDNCGRHQAIVYDGKTISLLMLAPSSSSDFTSILGGLVHEISHAADELFVHINEPKPCAELRCYTLQYMFQTLYPLVKEQFDGHPSD